MLDEPTAHLDSQTEQLIQQAINNYAKNHLVLVIAHRLNTVKNASSILVMQNGEIAQQGTYSQLEQQQGAFKSLLNLQAQGANND